MIAVFTCDIINSRIYPASQRQQLDAALRQAYTETCSGLPEAKADFLSFSIIQGDEFQFSVEAPQHFYGFLLMLRNKFALCHIQPQPCFRAGIGLGDRSIKGETSYQMDGSAYHNARKAILSFDLPTNKKRLSVLYTALNPISQAINVLLGFCDNLEQNWTIQQRRVIAHLLDKKSSAETAALMAVSRQNVYKLLSKAKWDLLNEALIFFRESLSQDEGISNDN